MNNAAKNREYGPREKITCNLPHSPRYRVSNGESLTTIADGILRDLETALCKEFGGYTATPSVGGWVDQRGTLLREEGTLYTVSYPPHAQSRANAIGLFTAAGERLGEEWVHIERSTFQAEHRKATASVSDYNNSDSGKPSVIPAVTDNERGLAKGLTDYVSNVERIRQLDKPTRDRVNDKSRSTPFTRR